MSKRKLYGKVRILHPFTPQLLMEKVTRRDLVMEIEERIHYKGATYNVHRSRHNPKLWGVSESTTGLSASAKKGSTSLEPYLHKTKELAIETMWENFKMVEARGEQVRNFSFSGNIKFKARQTLFMELKKLRIK